MKDYLHMVGQREQKLEISLVLKQKLTSDEDLTPEFLCETLNEIENIELFAPELVATVNKCCRCAKHRV